MRSGLVGLAAANEALEVFTPDAPTSLPATKLDVRDMRCVQLLDRLLRRCAKQPGDHGRRPHRSTAEWARAPFHVSRIRDSGSDQGYGLVIRAIVLAAIARRVRGLKIVDPVSATLRPWHHMVSVDIPGLNRLSAQRAEPIRLLPEVSAQRAPMVGNANARGEFETEPRLEQERHALAVGCARLLEEVDDLPVERTVLALGELRQPGVQVGVQTDHQTNGDFSHELSVHHDSSAPCLIVSVYTKQHYRSTIAAWQPPRFARTGAAT